MPTIFLVLVSISISFYHLLILFLAPEAAEYTQYVYLTFILVSDLFLREESGDFGSQHNLQDAEADYDAQQQYAIEVRNGLRLPELAAPKPDMYATLIVEILTALQHRTTTCEKQTFSCLVKIKKEGVYHQFRVHNRISFRRNTTTSVRNRHTFCTSHPTTTAGGILAFSSLIFAQIEHLEAEILSLLTLRNSGWEERNT